MATIDFASGGVSITGALESQSFRLVDTEGNSTLDLTNLQTQIQNISDGLVSEMNSRQTNDGLLEASINTLTSDLNSESITRENADTALQSNIDDVASDLSAEVSARQTADSTLQTNFDTVSTNLSSEVTNRTNADTALQSAINLKAPINNPTFTGTVSGISKSMVGLGNVDNTTDLNKPISTATQTALDLKANITYVDQKVAGVVDSAPETLNTLNELATALGNDPSFATTTANLIGTKAPINNPTFTGTVSGITKSMVGLGNVDNTADLLKPLSNASVSALALKADLSRTLYQNTSYVNAGQNTLSSVISGLGSSQDQTVVLSSGTHNNASDSAVAITLNNFTLMAMEGAGAQPSTFSGAITLNGSTQTRVRVSNIQFGSVFTISGTSGRHYFRGCNFGAGFTISGAMSNWVQFDSCSFTGALTIPNTFAGLATFIRCDFTGATLTLNNLSPAQVVFSTCSSLPSFTLNATYSGLNGTASSTKLDIAQANFTSTVSGITKAMVGLGNVDNTSDANKPISTATQTALDLKAPIANPTFTGTVSGITKAMVGLGNVDNTADANKPVSTATQTALDLKAPISNPTFTGTVSGITKAMVGLGNVDNTTDANKPISTATQTALNAKQNTLNSATGITVEDINCRDIFATGINADFANLGGDLTVGGALYVTNLPAKTAETNVVYFDTTSKTMSYGTVSGGSGGSANPAGTDTQVQFNDAGSFGGDSGLTYSKTTDTLSAVNLSVSGTATGISKSMVGLGNVDNTSDASKPISTATQTALDLKAPLANPTFTGTVSGITKAMVGLGNVDNTSDANKPISTATQSALDAKQNTLNTSSDVSINSLTTVGNLTVDTNLLKTDATNNRVGINQSTPAYALDVVGSLNITGSYLVNGSALTTSSSPTMQQAIYRIANTQNVANSVFATVLWTTTISNGITGFSHNSTTGDFTVNNAGLYTVSWTLGWAANSTNNRGTWLEWSGSQTGGSNNHLGKQYTTGQNQWAQSCVSLYLTSVPTTFKIIGFQNSGATLSIRNDTDSTTAGSHIIVTRIA